MVVRFSTNIKQADETTQVQTFSTFCEKRITQRAEPAAQKTKLPSPENRAVGQEFVVKFSRAATGI